MCINSSVVYICANDLTFFFKIFTLPSEELSQFIIMILKISSTTLWHLHSSESYHPSHISSTLAPVCIIRETNICIFNEKSEPS